MIIARNKNSSVLTSVAFYLIKSIADLLIICSDKLKPSFGCALKSHCAHFSDCMF